MEKLIDLFLEKNPENFGERFKESFRELCSQSGRYPLKALDEKAMRANWKSVEEGKVPYAAIIHPDNPSGGVYGGMSFVVFPIEGNSCLIAMGVGSQGLSPDEAILSRPGHSRKLNAICKWLNIKYGQGTMVAWAKTDPTRKDLPIPENIQSLFPEYDNVFDRYGHELYAIIIPKDNRELATIGAKAFIDLYYEERGIKPRAGKPITDSDKIREDYYQFLLPSLTEEEVFNQLLQRRFMIIQGPPGTGKTKMAEDLISKRFQGHGKSIQFHPNTTYESFIGGLSPIKENDMIGFSFSPKKGHLMEAIEEACKSKKPYLLHVDEINRADLGKVLGESIYLLEFQSKARTIDLSYDFGLPFGNSLALPDNLYIIGTMNSADRSIAILDIAVRRRFGFVSLWPQLTVVSKFGSPKMVEAFKKLLQIFIEEASDESFNLMPGHSYFLVGDDNIAGEQLRMNLVPLLEEYLLQGYVNSFSDTIRSYIQWVITL